MLRRFASAMTYLCSVHFVVVFIQHALHAEGFLVVFMEDTIMDIHLLLSS